MQENQKFERDREREREREREPFCSEGKLCIEWKRKQQIYSKSV